MLERCHQQPCEDLKPLLLENAVCPKPVRNSITNNIFYLTNIYILGTKNNV